MTGLQVVIRGDPIDGVSCVIIWLLNKSEKKGGGNPPITDHPEYHIRYLFLDFLVLGVFEKYHNASEDNRQYLNLVHFETRDFLCLSGR